MRFVLIILAFVFCNASAQLPDPSTIDLSDVSPQAALKMRAHAAALRGKAEEELVASLTELSAAQSQLAKAAHDQEKLDQEIAKLEAYATQKEQDEAEALSAKKRAQDDLVKEKEHSARLAKFCHAVLFAVFIVVAALVWRMSSALSLIFVGPYGILARVGISLAAGAVASYGVWLLLSRL